MSRDDARPTVYALMIMKRSGHQESNNFWPIGHWLHWRPEDHEAMGPGGWATFEPVKPVDEATFYDYEGAGNSMKFMHDNFPGVECEIVPFVAK